MKAKKPSTTERKRKLVVGHLENVSGQLFEQYPSAIRELIRGKSGVYALYKNSSLYYVGLANDLMRRLKQHLKDRHNGKWNRFSVYLTVHDGHMKELESLLLRISFPKGNAVRGRFSASQSLRRVLDRQIKSQDEDKRARLLGGRQADRRVKKKAKKVRGTKILAGVFDRTVQLRGWHKEYEYRATLRRNGTISYDGYIYSSLSAAGSDARGIRTNGWSFWHYKDSRGDWVPLNRLKR